jgi:hypothetical protein
MQSNAIARLLGDTCESNDLNRLEKSLSFRSVWPRNGKGAIASMFFPLAGLCIDSGNFLRQIRTDYSRALPIFPYK